MIKFSNIGLAYRAGAVLLGQNSVINNIKNNTIKLVIMTSDASDSTKRNISAKCDNNNIELLIIEQKNDELSKALGKKNIKIIGITDKNFSKLIKK